MKTILSPVSSRCLSLAACAGSTTNDAALGSSAASSTAAPVRAGCRHRRHVGLRPRRVGRRRAAARRARRVEQQRRGQVQGVLVGDRDAGSDGEDPLRQGRLRQHGVDVVRDRRREGERLRARCRCELAPTVPGMSSRRSPARRRASRRHVREGERQRHAHRGGRRPHDRDDRPEEGPPRLFEGVRD